MPTKTELMKMLLKALSEEEMPEMMEDKSPPAKKKKPRAKKKRTAAQIKADKERMAKLRAMRKKK